MNSTRFTGLDTTKDHLLTNSYIGSDEHDIVTEYITEKDT